MIDVENDDAFLKNLEHRRGAKDRSINNTAVLIQEKGPLNSSSFNDLVLAPGQSQLLYSKSGERDRTSLEQF